MTDSILKATLDRLDRAGRQADRATARAEQAMRQTAAVLEEQRRFAIDASHELRTCLAGLRAELEEARMHPDQTDLGELLERTLAGVGRLQAAIGDLLLLATTEQGEPRESERVDLGELAAEAAPEGADVVCVPGHGVTVEAVRPDLAQALAILLGRARRGEGDGTVVRVRVRRDGDCAELTVTGDGAAAEHERMERLTRLDTFPRGDQAGLSLAVARGIAHAHHGTLWAYLRPSGARSFVLRLPVAASGDGDTADLERVAHAPRPFRAA
ncbi:HAMP domain-containing sensor histidine kinase [Sphaerisporangium sp. NPDC005288]|uniref:sensor histidine kinase n=1 Tax=Sphaerisporangium sp. NPDC005288 TaxID=3155114 RepID=UPI0033BDCD32